MEVVDILEWQLPPRPTIATDLRLEPQAKTVLLHLRNNGSISPMQALVVYGISRLAACIYDLRKAGYDVGTEMKHDAQGHKYARYWLFCSGTRGEATPDVSGRVPQGPLRLSLSALLISLLGAAIARSLP